MDWLRARCPLEAWPRSTPATGAGTQAPAEALPWRVQVDNLSRVGRSDAASGRRTARARRAAGAGDHPHAREIRGDTRHDLSDFDIQVRTITGCRRSTFWFSPH